LGIPVFTHFLGGYISWKTDIKSDFDIFLNIFAAMCSRLIDRNCSSKISHRTLSLIIWTRGKRTLWHCCVHRFGISSTGLGGCSYKWRHEHPTSCKNHKQTSHFVWHQRNSSVDSWTLWHSRKRDCRPIGQSWNAERTSRETLQHVDNITNLEEQFQGRMA